jgi:hypothetical protein
VSKRAHRTLVVLTSLDQRDQAQLSATANAR